jgi:hypothetical protein
LTRRLWMAWARVPRHGVLAATAPSLSTGEPSESSRRVGGVSGNCTGGPGGPDAVCAFAASSRRRTG